MATTLELSRMYLDTIRILMKLTSEDTVQRVMNLYGSKTKERVPMVYTRIKDLQTEEEILAVIEEMESELGQTE